MPSSCDYSGTVEDTPQRLWTVEEANAVLPQVAELLERIRATIPDVRERAKLLGEHSPHNGHVPENDATAQLRQAVGELERLGIVLRDAEQGLVDFPAQSPSGRIYWLCWLAGEPEVGFWHWPEDGFAGRRPLSDPPD
jgi:hypothetical protein